MKILDFSFKAEPIWMAIFSLSPVIIGVLILLGIWLARYLL